MTKRLISFAATLATSTLLFAQSFTVTTKSGETFGYNNEDVESIDFSLESITNPSDPTDFTASFKSISPAEGIIDLEATPAGVGTINVTLNGVFMANTKCRLPLLVSNSEGIIFSGLSTAEGILVSRNFSEGTSDLTVRVNRNGVTAPGNYSLLIPEGFLCTTSGNPLGGAVKVWVIEQPSPEQTFSATPESGTVTSIGEVSIKFDHYPVVERLSDAKVSLYKEGIYSPVATATPVVASDGSVKVSFSPAVTEGGNYTVTFPEAAFRLYESEGSRVQISSELKLTYRIEGEEQRAPRIGDFYYSDGTWSTTLINKADAKPIGIIFYVGIASAYGDNKAFYKVKDGSAAMPEFHGYVVAINDATYTDGSHNPVAWSFFDGNDKGCGCSSESDDFLGYTNTLSIRNRAVKDFGGLSAESTNFPAAYYAAVAYEEQNPAPAQSSGWFLPSAMQLKYIYDNVYFEPNGNPDSPYLEKSFNELGALGAPMYTRDSEYWSSTEQYDSSGCSYRAMYVCFDESSFSPGFKSWYNKSANFRVRAILAF